jgi:cystathionine gamma-synthase
LPRWADNVGYEEAEPRVVEKLESGYPRFVLHPTVKRLFEATRVRLAQPHECCFVFPSPAVARRAAAYVGRHGSGSTRICSLDQGLLTATCADINQQHVLMQYWQHSGEIVTSRTAAAALGEQRRESTGEEGQRAQDTMRQRLADLIGVAADDVYFYPTGMAAVLTAFRVLQRIWPDRHSVQFGFPYVDILKIQQRFGSGVHFFPDGSQQDLNQLEQLLSTERILGLVCEFPGNPLLKSPDLAKLAELARRHEFPLVVDDTIGALINVDVSPVTDIIATSLTKYFSGTGDVMGGCLILNPVLPHYQRLRTVLEELHQDLVFADDAVVLERNSRDYAQRVGRINRTADIVCEALRTHPLVDRVDYPKYRTAENYRAWMRPQGGYGGLFSMQLHEAETRAPQFFDRLTISKGPNLGTNFSLCCPYTILAHYHELDFAESCGISRYLIRASVGLEDPDWLIERFYSALDACGADAGGGA